MKRVIWCVSFIIVICIGLRCYYSAQFYSVACRPNTHVCVRNNRMSDELCAHINQSLSVCDQQHLSAHAIIAELQNQFPVIKKIVIAYHPARTQLKIKLHKPVCSINNLFVLTADTLAPQSYFSESARTSIPSLDIAHESMGNAASFAQAIVDVLPHTAWNDWNVSCMNEHCIKLIDKKNSKFAVLYSIDQKISSDLLTQCALIQKNMMARGAFDRGMEWIADTRFAHYIVAYKA